MENRHTEDVKRLMQISDFRTGSIFVLVWAMLSLGAYLFFLQAYVGETLYRVGLALAFLVLALSVQIAIYGYNGFSGSIYKNLHAVRKCLLILLLAAFCYDAVYLYYVSGDASSVAYSISFFGPGLLTCFTGVTTRLAFHIKQEELEKQ